ncbi:hypothetical protein PMIN01_03593 [Paraphaeosphaeria minitans]|uniref:Uncharacterized protein n=1 Tax=Paraphaeosphaeria minitans TaxID=565426 RepID=A0A9P6KTI5_9PLEO|nr:hypothetical protein PMIN01_03593 [Paraphaeosphaeria minitans]
MSHSRIDKNKSPVLSPDPSTIYTLATKTAHHDVRATDAPSASMGPPPVIDHVSRDHDQNISESSAH